jgi:hypothetical protein
MSQSSWRFSPSPAKGEIAMRGAILAVITRCSFDEPGAEGGGRQTMTGYSVQERDVAVRAIPTTQSRCRSPSTNPPVPSCFSSASCTSGMVDHMPAGELSLAGQDAHRIGRL